MTKYIPAMQPNEVGFLDHQVILNDKTQVNPNSPPSLKFATTLDKESFIHLTVVYENGLVTFHDGNTNILWTNKEPIFSTSGDITIVTFEK